MNVWQSLLYGALQGATEFLPVSSSGHILLANKLLGTESSLFYTVMLHVGTLLAVVIGMRKEVFGLLKKSNRKLLLYLVLASLPTFAIALAVKLLLDEKIFNGLLPIGFALSIVSLSLSYFFSKEKHGICSPVQGVIAGIAQGFALIPGFSRSGATISALTLQGVKRTEAVRFSFLMSLPVIVASGVVEGYSALKSDLSIDPVSVIVGCAAAFVVGLISLRLLIRIAQKNTFLFFALYLFIPLVLSLLLF